MGRSNIAIPSIYKEVHALLGNKYLMTNYKFSVIRPMFAKGCELNHSTKHCKIYAKAYQLCHLTKCPRFEPLSWPRIILGFCIQYLMKGKRIINVTKTWGLGLTPAAMARVTGISAITLICGVCKIFSSDTTIYFLNFIFATLSSYYFSQF